MGGNVFPPLLGSPYLNVLNVGGYECKCSMMPRNDGNHQAYSWVTYTFIRLWLCAMVREKMTKKWATFLCPPEVGNIKELKMKKERNHVITSY